jgi:hypothetical protein
METIRIPFLSQDPEMHLHRMKTRILWRTWPLLFLLACSPKLRQDIQPSSVAVDTMPVQVDLLERGTLTGQLFEVSGYLMATSSYCGGAAPSQEILNAYYTPHGWQGQTLIVRRGAVNQPGKPLVQRAVTDAEGKFVFHLPAGQYCIALSEKELPRRAAFYNIVNQPVDKACDDRWLQTCELTFEVVDKGIDSLKISIHQACFVSSHSPCVHYSGPLPP